MKKFKPLLLASMFVITAHAGSNPGMPSSDASMATTSEKKETCMTDGEVRKLDKDAKKITLTHGEIKNLDMPGMTMVFRVKDNAMLDNIKVGDKIKFTAEQSGGAIVVTEIKKNTP